MMAKGIGHIVQWYKHKAMILCTLLPVLVSTLGVLWWALASDDLQDDHYFRHIVPKPYDDHALNFAEFEKFDSPLIVTIDDAVESIRNHYSIFNARLGDKLLILSSLLPTWVVDMMHALVYALMIMLFLSLIKSDWWKYPLLVALVVASVWLFLPWDRLYSSNAYFFNYLWSATMNLAFVVMLFKCRACTKSTCLLSVVAFVASMMHEGFALPVGIGLVVMTIQRRVVSKSFQLFLKEYGLWLIPIFVYLLGILFYTFCPGLWWRIENPWDRAVLSDYVHAYTAGAVPMWVAVVLVFVDVRRQGGNCLRKLIDKNLFYIVVIVISMLLSLLTSTFDRAWWLAYMFSILLIFNLLLEINAIKRFLTKFSFFQMALCVIVDILLIVFFIGVCKMQSTMTVESQQCRSMLDASGSNFICVDTHSRSDMSRGLLNIPLGVKEDYPFKEYYRIKGPGTPVIYPECYAKISFDEFQKVEGNNPLRGDYPWYYSPTRLNREERTFNVTFGDPDIGESDGNINVFFSLRRWLAKLNGGTGRLQRVYEFHEVPVRVSDDMRQKGVSSADTVWFYMFEKNEKSLKGCQVIRIDKFEIEDYERN